MIPSYKAALVFHLNQWFPTFSACGDLKQWLLMTCLNSVCEEAHSVRKLLTKAIYDNYQLVSCGVQLEYAEFAISTSCLQFMDEQTTITGLL